MTQNTCRMDGLTGLAEYLRGDKARDFIQSLPR
jgi:hypothetical protein